mmetsp:Transcript_61772/g.164228  ORF Transcript_61772/g.164228 Transcript_61772/m.164228 type:complete len:390 (+) Transcript_61772:113-1282(+)
MGCVDSKSPNPTESCSIDNPATAVSKGNQSAPASPGSSTQSTRTGSKSDSRMSTSSVASERSRESILGRFAFAKGDKALLGEGTSSVCYLGSDVETGDAVAIKVYKPSRKGSATLAKFKRQVSVLQELQRPLERPAEEALWCEELASADPADLFLKLLDFSKDSDGEPAPDQADGRLYIVTELAQCTLKDWLRLRSQRSSPLSAESVRKIAGEVVLATAWLHAKGFVHLDIKPENIMMCGGRWKLIDMDGCVRAGSVIKMYNSSVSFSPCYCAPEFARLVVKGSSMVVKPSMDAWSVGMTIAELVNLCPLLRAKYQQISAGQSAQAGTMSFLKWLGAMQAMGLPRRPAWSQEGQFKALLYTCLLVPDPEFRNTLAQSLRAPYFRRQNMG